MRHQGTTVQDKSWRAALPQGLRLGDVVVVFVTGVLAYAVRTGSVALPSTYVIAILLACLLTYNYFQAGRGYGAELIRRPQGQMAQVVIAWGMVLVTVLAIGYFAKMSGQFSRLWFGLWAVFALIGFLSLRVALMATIRRLRRDGRLGRRLAIVGSGEDVDRLVRHLRSSVVEDIDIVGYLGVAGGAAASAKDAVSLGTLDHLDEVLKVGSIETLCIVGTAVSPEVVEAVGRATQAMPVEVHLCPSTAVLDYPVHTYDVIAGIPMLEMSSRPLSDWELMVKEAEDKVIAAVLLVLFAPLMALIALAIRLDSPGPVFYRQKRAGFRNDTFEMFKFRTMHVRDEDSEPDVPQAQRRDPRVTRVGAVLRRTSLDELPQLFNVLNGTMSLVGPRPHAVAHGSRYEALLDDYLSRHRVRPGITGWAQINGLRGETDTLEKMRQRVKFDLHYIENWSILFDLRILAVTAFVGFVHRNAY